MQKRLKNLFDNYISGFPENNLGKTRYVENVFEDKIITDYYDSDRDIVIEITDSVITNQFEIKKIENRIVTVQVGVLKKKNDTTPEQTIKTLYGTLALTR